MTTLGACQLGTGPQGHAAGVASPEVASIQARFGDKTVNAVIKPAGPAMRIWVMRLDALWPNLDRPASLVARDRRAG